jgi:hypothetical protein
MMSSSLPAMVVTAANKVSIILLLVPTSPFSGAYFPGVVPTFPFSGAYFPGMVPTFPFSGAYFPVQWCLLSRSLIFIFLTLLIGPNKVLQGKNYLYACLICKAFRELRHYDKTNQCCLRPC